MKKTFAVVLAAMMLIAAFAGCGAKKDAEPKTPPVVAEEAETSPEVATEKTVSPEAPETSKTPETAETSADSETSESPVTDASVTPAA